MGSGALVLVWSHPTCFGVIRVSFLKIGVTFSYGLGIRQMIYPRTSTENVTSDSPQLSPKGRHNTRDATARVKIRFSPALAQGATQHEGRSGASQKGGERDKKEGCNTRTSQEVTHPSTTLAQARLTSEFRWDPVL